MPIGFVGLGRMGGAMAGRLIEAGLDVVGYDHSDSASREFVARGGRICRSAREVADSAEIVFASLPTLEASREAAFGADGVIHGSHIRVHVETSTIGVRLAAELAEQFAKDGRIAFVDAPVSGAAKAAKEGTLTVMMAAPADAVSQVSEIWRSMAKEIFVVGTRAGQGQLFKLVNNYISMNVIGLTCEAVAAGAHAGADPSQLIEVINCGTGRSFASSYYFPELLLHGKQTGKAAMGLKDVELFVEAAADAGIECRLGSGLIDAWRSAKQANLSIGDWYSNLLDNLR